MTMSLFNEPEWIPIQDGQLLWLPEFLTADESQRFYNQLSAAVPWRQEPISMFGRTVLQPRLQAWYGDKTYSYSGLTMSPEPWISPLLNLKQRCEHVAQTSFNSVLANYYRDGNDSMGWHQDNEAELGLNPIIASISLGETRRFVLKHLHCKSKYELELTSGSLLIMAGTTQHFWQHGIPKTKRAKHGRINLTFRTVY